MVAAPRRRATTATSLILVSLAYYLAAESAFAIGTLTQMFAPFWPPNVVLLCALLVVPPGAWWLFIAAVFPAHAIAELGVGTVTASALQLGLGLAGLFAGVGFTFFLAGLGLAAGAMAALAFWARRGHEPAHASA